MKTILRKNKWLIISQFYPPEIGAPQTRLHTFAKIMMEKGFDVEVLTAMPNYPTGRIFKKYRRKLYCKEEIDGVSVKRVWIYPASGKKSTQRLLNYMSFTFTALIAVIFMKKPGIIFLESQPLTLGIIVILCKIFFNIPYIYNIPDLQVEVSKQLQFIKNRTILKIMVKLENYFMKYSFKVSTVTSSIIEHLKERGVSSNKLTLLPNGADINFLKPLAPSNHYNMRWGLNNFNVFLYAGNFSSYHGLDVIIEAATLLKNEKSIAILMVGDGPERKKLEKISNDRKLNNLIWGGPIDFEEMNLVYSITYCSLATLKKMDVAKYFRLAKITTSLSCGVPVIFSGIGEYVDILNRYNLGITINPENPTKLAESILYLSSNPSIRDKMSSAAREYAEEHCDWDKIISKWIRSLDQDSEYTDTESTPI